MNVTRTGVLRLVLRPAVRRALVGRSRSRARAQAAVGLCVLRQSQANPIEVSNPGRAELEALRPTLPADLGA